MVRRNGALSPTGFRYVAHVPPMAIGPQFAGGLAQAEAARHARDAEAMPATARPRPVTPAQRAAGVQLAPDEFHPKAMQMAPPWPVNVPYKPWWWGPAQIVGARRGLGQPPGWNHVQILGLGQDAKGTLFTGIDKVLPLLLVTAIAVAVFSYYEERKR